jgi:hypothetical protein
MSLISLHGCITQVVDIHTFKQVPGEYDLCILKLIINPFIYVDKYERTQKKSLDTIGEVLEPFYVDSYYIKSITKDTNS